MKSKVTHVVAGVIFDRYQRLLACERPAGKAFAGKWEFPGGKVEKNESLAHALERELKEELALDDVLVLDEMYSMEVCLSPEKILILHFLRVLCNDTVEVTSCEGQQFRWLKKDELFSVDWLATDHDFVGYINKCYNLQDAVI